MRSSARRILLPALALAAGLATFAADLSQGGVPGLFTRAEAIIGRPLTPMSYAGVARRTTYRAATVAAPVVVAPVVVAPRPGCFQVVDAYGAVTWRCP